MDEHVTIPARILPRDAADLMISTGVNLLQSVLFLVPAFLVSRATASTPMAIATALGLYLLFAAHRVRSLDVGIDGIRFNRWLGRPKLIPWDQFRSAGIATRRELVLRGWLWPPFPAREMTPSYTSLGHCRFDYTGGYCYYPPANAEQLLNVIESYKGLGIPTEQRESPHDVAAN